MDPMETEWFRWPVTPTLKKSSANIPSRPAAGSDHVAGVREVAARWCLPQVARLSPHQRSVLPVMSAHLAESDLLLYNVQRGLKVLASTTAPMVDLPPPAHKASVDQNLSGKRPNQGKRPIHHRQARKAKPTSLRRKSTTSSLGEPLDEIMLTIPASYPGWFQVMDSADPSVTMVNTIEDLATLQVKAFLLLSDTDVLRGGGQAGYLPERLPAGHVLAAQAVCVDASRARLTGAVLGCLVRCLPPASRHKVAAHCCPGHEHFYLQCRDSRGGKLLCPFDTQGAFSPVGGRDSPLIPGTSYQLADIIRMSSLPIRLRLVHGHRPASLKTFSGMVTLQEVYHESSILGCSIVTRGADTSHFLVEFPLDADVQFQKDTTKGDNPEDSPAGLSAVEFCRAHGDSFLDRMKVLQSLKTEFGDWGAFTNGLTRDEQLSLQTLTNTSSEYSSDGDSLTDTSVCHGDGDSQGTRGTLVNGRELPLVPPVGDVNRHSELEEKEDTGSDTVARDSDVGSHTCDSDDGSYDVIPACSQRCSKTPGDGAVGGRSVDPLDDPAAGVERAQSLASSSTSGTQGVPTESSRHDDDGYLLPVELRRGLLHPSAPGLPLPPGVLGTDAGGDPLYALSMKRIQGPGSSQDEAVVTIPSRPSGPAAREAMESVPAGDQDRRALQRPVIASDDNNTASLKDGCDRDRLDAFLTDSLRQLKRRQSHRGGAGQGAGQGGDGEDDGRDDGRRDDARADKTVPASFQSQEDVHKFLAVLFDQIEDNPAAEVTLSSGGDGMPESGGGGIHRSVSLPDSRSSIPPGAPAGYDAVSLYQQSLPAPANSLLTGDSGIYLGPRSTGSDTWRDNDTSLSELWWWRPPDRLDGLSVEEVGLCLRHIGLGQAAIGRFREELIDGHQLTELDEQILKEAFPGLNALDRKKLLDFVHRGWRPKYRFSEDLTS